jgi:hypothetical protein
MLEVQFATATYRVWSEVRKQSDESARKSSKGKGKKAVAAVSIPTHFRLRLSCLLLGCLSVLGAVAILAKRAETASLRTYIYLVPTSELMECEKRAFFVKTIGPQVLYNVEIDLKDNKSGAVATQKYSEIDPGPQSQDEYLWLAPSSRWDEDYTATVETRDSRSSQRLVVRSTKSQLTLATEVSISGERAPVLKCRDSQLPAAYKLASGESRSCTELMKLEGDIPTQLDVIGYQHPNGQYTIRKIAKRPSPSELDDQSDERHLTEYQQELLKPVLNKYPRSKLFIYYAGGDKSRRYATEFRNFFSPRWNVTGPEIVLVGDEQIIDVQMTVGARTTEGDRAVALRDGFERSGIKHRRLFDGDPAVPNDEIVLWVGPKSPRGASADQCLGPELKPRLDRPNACEWSVAGNCTWTSQ